MSVKPQENPLPATGQVRISQFRSGLLGLGRSKEPSPPPVLVDEIESDKENASKSSASQVELEAQHSLQE